MSTSVELVVTYPCKTKDCSGRAVPIVKEGRFYMTKERPWLVSLLPSNIEIPRCTVCNKDQPRPEDEAIIAKTLNHLFLEHAALIAVIIEEHKHRIKQKASEQSA